MDHIVNNRHVMGASGIDFEFIKELEGSLLTSGFVPNNHNNKKGVTLSAGFDLGALSENDLRKLALNATLIGKLYPYLGRQGTDAVNYLGEFPLTISEHEAAAIDSGVKLSAVVILTERYNADSQLSFAEIPNCWQTVIASVEFQHGDLSTRFPSFWKSVSLQNWDNALIDLHNIGDEGSARRKKETNYIIANA